MIIQMCESDKLRELFKVGPESMNFLVPATESVEYLIGLSEECATVQATCHYVAWSVRPDHLTFAHPRPRPETAERGAVYYCRAMSLGIPPAPLVLPFASLRTAKPVNLEFVQSLLT
jgi:hypothetical protein